MNRAARPAEVTGNQDRTRAAALITAADLAQTMQISVRTLWRLVSAGKVIQPIRIGGNTRWRLLEVEQWIADGCPPPSEIRE